MSSICFVGTQMQVINCVEYLKKSNTTNNILFVVTTDIIREKQVFEILSMDGYNDLFKKVKSLSLGNSRYINFFLSFYYAFFLILYSFFDNSEIVIIGNYRLFYARLFERLKRHKKHLCVVLDDGLATLSIFRERRLELDNQYLSCFCPNRILYLIQKISRNKYIPKNVCFFSVFTDIIENDTFIYNEYKYLKTQVKRIGIPELFLNADIVFLGQPLYFKNDCMDPFLYSNYINQFASENIGKKIVYYAHPEESSTTWELLTPLSCYSFVPNIYSFEIISSVLKPGCRVVSFFTSVLANLPKINDSLIAESIYINDNEIMQRKFYENILCCYRMFEENKIIIHKYDVFSKKNNK